MSDVLLLFQALAAFMATWFGNGPSPQADYESDIIHMQLNSR